MSQKTSHQSHRTQRIARALFGLLLAFSATLPAAQTGTVSEMKEKGPRRIVMAPQQATQNKACRIIIQCTVLQDITICNRRCL
jgi:hypothetical protein